MLSNCTKSRNFSCRLYGDSIPPRKLKTANQGGLQCTIRVVLMPVIIFGHASQTFHGEVSKNI